MKKIILTLTAIFMCITAHAKTETLNWYIDGNTYATTTCESGDDVLLPAAPTKRGYTFKGWANYQPIEYLESTGTQYIDTGLTPKNTMVFKSEVLFFDVINTNFVFGSRSSGASDTSTDQFYVGAQHLTGRQSSEIFGISGVTRNILVQNAKANTYYSVILSNSLATENGSFNMFLFGFNILGSPHISGEKRIKYAQIYDNDVLIRDFIPVLDYNGTPCMYDKVEKKFYYNQGTGQFIVGPVLTE